MGQSKDNIREALIGKINALNISQTMAAKKIGVSPSLINNVINRKYLSDATLAISEDTWRLIANWVGFSEWVTANTRNFARISGLCAHAQQSCISRAISFAPGSGKSHALKNYAASMRNVFYVECDEYWSKKDFLCELRKQMGITDGGYSISEMVSSIIEFLNRQDHPLVIIDEADKLKDGVLNFFKTFYNKTASGFMLCGAPFFEKRISKGVRMAKQTYQEIYSRIGGEFIHLKDHNIVDIKMICEANGVSDEGDVQHVYNYFQGDLRRAKSMIEKIKLERAAA